MYYTFLLSLHHRDIKNSNFHKVIQCAKNSIKIKLWKLRIKETIQSYETLLQNITWALKFTKINIVIQHWARTKTVVVDALSRCFQGMLESTDIQFCSLRSMVLIFGSNFKKIKEITTFVNIDNYLKDPDKVLSSN